jgi:hypothetical protein
VSVNRAQVFSAISMSAGGVIDVLRGKRKFGHLMMLDEPTNNLDPVNI